MAVNLVNAKTSVAPNYPLGKSAASVTLYLSRNKDVFIVGRIDPNYAGWAFLHKSDETDKSQSAFTQISGEEPAFVSSEHILLASCGLSYDELQGWYRADLCRAAEAGMAWRTPFGHYYGLSQQENNPGYFARDVAGYVKHLQALCQSREAGGAYKPVLEWCLQRLSAHGQDALYYRKCEELIEILEKESYLILSPKEDIRSLYLQIKQKSTALYNAYQSAVR